MKFEREEMSERGEMGEESLITKVSRIRFFDSLAIDVPFSDHQKCLDLILIYLSGLMISIGNLQII